MVSHWDRERLIIERAELAGKTIAKADEERQQFLGIGTGDLN